MNSIFQRSLLTLLLATPAQAQVSALPGALGLDLFLRTYGELMTHPPEVGPQGEGCCFVLYGGPHVDPKTKKPSNVFREDAATLESIIRKKLPKAIVFRLKTWDKTGNLVPLLLGLPKSIKYVTFVFSGHGFDTNPNRMVGEGRFFVEADRGPVFDPELARVFDGFRRSRKTRVRVHTILFTCHSGATRLNPAMGMTPREKGEGSTFVDLFIEGHQNDPRLPFPITAAGFYRQYQKLGESAHVTETDAEHRTISKQPAGWFVTGSITEGRKSAFREWSRN